MDYFSKGLSLNVLCKSIIFELMTSKQNIVYKQEEKFLEICPLERRELDLFLF